MESSTKLGDMYGEASPEQADRDYVELEEEPVIIIRKLFHNRHGASQHPGAVGRFKKATDLPNTEFLVLFLGPDGTDIDMIKTKGQATIDQGGVPAYTIAQWRMIRSADPLPVEPEVANKE